MERMILHLSGRDGPGITAALTQSIAKHKAGLVDLGQSVLHGFLTLSAIVDVPPHSGLVQELLVLTQAQHLKFEIIPFVVDTALGNQLPFRMCLTLIGKLTANTLASVTKDLAAQQLNLCEIRTLSKANLEGVEFICEFADSGSNKKPEDFLTKFEALKDKLYPLAAQLRCDLSIQKDSLYRRNRRLVVFDVDSTFIPFEIIDELGSLVGRGKEIAGITERAMAGELDFAAALRKRVALLKGLSLERAKWALQNIKPNPGVERLLKVLKMLGCKTGLVSGGFDFFVSELRQQYRMDFSFANKLQVKDGLITGELDGPIVDAARKAQIVKDMCEAYQCQLEQSIAVGDGSNDVEMLKIAGLGIAYQAKQKAQEAANVRLNFSDLGDILYLMGFRTDEISQLQL